jgi:hypothetical protein
MDLLSTYDPLMKGLLEFLARMLRTIPRGQQELWEPSAP